jgi:hypothetical protein
MKASEYRIPGSARRYRNPGYELGPSISRRQFDRLYGRQAGKYRSNEAQAKANLAANPELAKSRPARGRKAANPLLFKPKEVNLETKLRNVGPVKENKFRYVGYYVGRIKTDTLLKYYTQCRKGLVRNYKVFGASVRIMFQILDEGYDHDELHDAWVIPALYRRRDIPDQDEFLEHFLETLDRIATSKTIRLVSVEFAIRFRSVE